MKKSITLGIFLIIYGLTLESTQADLGEWHTKTMRFKILPKRNKQKMNLEAEKFWKDVGAWFEHSWLHEAFKSTDDLMKDFFGQSNNFQDSQKNCAQTGLQLANAAMLRKLPLKTNPASTDFLYWTSSGNLFNARTGKEESMDDKSRVYPSFCIHSPQK